MNCELKKKEIVERIAPAKGGQWRIIENDKLI